MELRALFNNKLFKIEESLSISKSSNKVNENDIKIDFTGYGLEDIPYQYQEIKIVRGESEEIENAEINEDYSNLEIVYTGFFDSPKFNKMKLQDEDRSLTLELISPYGMSTKRSISLIGIYPKEEAIRKILEPLINDGFTIEELNVSEGQITTNFILEKIEYCMNRISYKLNLFWYIDEKKRIFVNSLEYLFAKNPKLKISEANINSLKDEIGLAEISPSIVSSGYANIINIKNVRLFYSEKDSYSGNVLTNEGDAVLLNLPKTIKKGDTISFLNPIVVGEEYLNRYLDSIQSPSISQNVYDISVSIDKNGTRERYASYLNNSVYENTNNFSFDTNSGEEAELVFITDSFFSNLVTGFKWNGSDATICEIESNTALRYTAMRFLDSREVNKFKGIISNSGQVEKNIDYNEKWATVNELTEYAKSLKVENSNIINNIVIEIEDKEHDLSIGDIIEFDLESFYCKGKFAITDIYYSYKNDDDFSYRITLKKSDLVGTFIDVFRSKETQETTEDTVNTIIISEYFEENVEERHEVVVS